MNLKKGRQQEELMAMFGKFLLPVRKNKGHFAIKLHGYMKGNNFKHLNMKTKESTCETGLLIGKEAQHSVGWPPTHEWN